MDGGLLCETSSHDGGDQIPAPVFDRGGRKRKINDSGKGDPSGVFYRQGDGSNAGDTVYAYEGIGLVQSGAHAAG